MGGGGREGVILWENSFRVLIYLGCAGSIVDQSCTLVEPYPMLIEPCPVLPWLLQSAVSCSIEVASTSQMSQIALAQHLASLQLSGVEEETRLAAKALHTRASALNDAMCALTSHLTSTVVPGDINADTAVRR